MDTLNQLKLSNSTLTSVTMHKAKLIKCSLVNVTLHNSSISDSALNNCHLYDCIIHSSTLDYCKVYGIDRVLRCEFEGCELLPSQPSLSKLAVEIREMIFEECLDAQRNGNWNGRTPSLLVALRGDNELYFQALEIFRKTNSFILNGNRIKRFMSMPETVLSNIRKVSISITGFPSGTKSIHKAFGSCTKLAEILLSSSRSLRYDESRLVFDWVEAVVPQCRVLRLLSFSPDLSRQFPAGRKVQDMNNIPRPLTLIRTLEEISYGLGLDARKGQANAIGRTPWIWIAEEETTLTWKKC